MIFPLFVSIEPNLYEETAYPIEISWSLPNGQIKTTLIIPEPDWKEWSALNEDHYGISRETLFQQGVSAQDVIREFDQDSEEQSTIFFYDLAYESLWLDRLYASADIEPPVEGISAHQALDSTPEEVRVAVREVVQDLGLDTDSSQGRVTALLHVYRRLHEEKEH